MAGWASVQFATASIANASVHVFKAYGSNVTAGHVLTLASQCPDAGALLGASVSDSQGNSWTMSKTRSVQENATQLIAWAVAKTTGANTASVIYNNVTSATGEIYLGEFAPPSGTASQDGTFAFAEAATGSVITTPAGPGTGSNDLLINLVSCGANFTSYNGVWQTIGTTSGDGSGYSMNSAGNTEIGRAHV